MLKFATSAAVAGCLANVNALMISESRAGPDQLCGWLTEDKTNFIECRGGLRCKNETADGRVKTCQYAQLNERCDNDPDFGTPFPNCDPNKRLTCAKYTNIEGRICQAQPGDNAYGIGEHFATDKDFLRVLVNNKMEKEDYYKIVKGHLVEGREECVKNHEDCLYDVLEEIRDRDRDEALSIVARRVTSLTYDPEFLLQTVSQAVTQEYMAESIGFAVQEVFIEHKIQNFIEDVIAELGDAWRSDPYAKTEIPNRVARDILKMKDKQLLERLIGKRPPSEDEDERHTQVVQQLEKLDWNELRFVSDFKVAEIVKRNLYEIPHRQ